jgi:type IV pilus assembly protein PilA
VKANMKAVFTAEKAYLQEKDKFISEINILGFSPERGNRYTYWLVAGASLQNRATADLDTSSTTLTGIAADTFKFDSTTGVASDQAGAFTAVVNSTNLGYFTAVAGGNIDNDTTLDQWSVSSISRASATASDTNKCAAGNNPAGEPCNDQNDVSL